MTVILLSLLSLKDTGFPRGKSIISHPSFLEASINIQCKIYKDFFSNVWLYHPPHSLLYALFIYYKFPYTYLLQVTTVNKHKSLAARIHSKLNSGIESSQLTDFCGIMTVI